MRPSRIVLPSVAVLALSLPAALAAADESLHATLGLTSGYSDNILNGASSNVGNVANAAPIQADLFATVSPGLLFTHEGRRMVQTARYVWNARLYNEHGEANSYASNLNYQALIQATPVSEIGIMLAGVNGRTNTFEFASAEVPLETRPNNGGLAYASGGVSVFYQRALSRDWRTRDQVSAAAFVPVDADAQVGSNYVLSNTALLERGWGYNAVAGIFRTTYSSIETRDAAQMLVARDASILAGPEVRWLHDWTPSISTDLSGGLTAAIRASDFRRGAVMPTASAYVRYLRDLAQVSVGWRHFVDTNIFSATTSLNHVFEVRGGMPFGREERLVLSGMAGYGRGRFLDLNAQALVGKSEFIVFDTSLTWRLNDSLFSSLRYGLRRQVRDQASLGIVNELTVRRDIMLSIEGRYPSREAARVPGESLRAEGETLDADKVGGRAGAGRR